MANYSDALKMAALDECIGFAYITSGAHFLSAQAEVSQGEIMKKAVKERNSACRCIRAYCQRFTINQREREELYLLCNCERVCFVLLPGRWIVASWD